MLLDGEHRRGRESTSVLHQEEQNGHLWGTASPTPPLKIHLCVPMRPQGGGQQRFHLGRVLSGSSRTWWSEGTPQPELAQISREMIWPTFKEEGGAEKVCLGMHTKLSAQHPSRVSASPRVTSLPSYSTLCRETSRIRGWKLPKV